MIAVRPHFQLLGLPQASRLLLQMRSLALATSVAASALIVGTAAAQGTGTWELRSYGGGARNPVELRLVTRESATDRDETSFDIPATALVGLSSTTLEGADAAVQFRIVRDAGTFVCVGRAGRGLGAGTFTFEPNPDFGAQLANRGYARPTPSEQFQLALNDVGYAILDELHSEGYSRPGIDQLVEMGQHGVTVEYVRGMKAMGYHFGSVDRLIALRDHGVDPEFVRELVDVGYSKLDADQLLTLRDHGVTRKYIAELAKLGYTSVAPDELVEARDHGVNAGWVAELQRVGYTHVTLHQLIELRDHGVSASFAARTRRDGEPLPSVEELIRRRDHGDDNE